MGSRAHAERVAAAADEAVIRAENVRVAAMERIAATALGLSEQSTTEHEATLEPKRAPARRQRRAQSSKGTQSMNSALRITCLVALLAACHSASNASPRTLAEAQIERGSRLFAANCAKCHGDGGEGTDDAPPVVGKDALPLQPRPDQKLRSASFHTAKDVATFVRTEMPPKANLRAKLSSTDYWSIVAFVLNANGVEFHAPVGADNASSFVLHL
jgi:mono/diheme cytochrome c family protein